MSEVEERTLLEELDTRQDQVIRELDELNARIERLIEDWRPKADPPAAAEAA